MILVISETKLLDGLNEQYNRSKTKIAISF